MFIRGVVIKLQMGVVYAIKAKKVGAYGSVDVGSQLSNVNFIAL